MSARCSMCGGNLAAPGGACPRCGGGQIATADTVQMEWGMVDLGSPPDAPAAAAPALPPLLDAPAPRAAPVPPPPVLDDGMPALLDAPLGRGPAAKAPQARKKAKPPGGAGPGDPAADALHAGGQLLDDPLSDGFDADAAALELDAPAPKRPARSTEDAPHEAAAPGRRGAKAPRRRPRSPEERRAMELAAIAGYGPAPTAIWGCVPYGVRVALRKSALGAKVDSLTEQRERLDAQLEEALCSLGEVLFAMRGDPQLASLKPQLASVENADAQLGSASSEGRSARDQAAHELETVNQQLHALEREAAPIRQRERQYAEALADVRARIRQAEIGKRKGEAELEMVRRAKGGVDTARYAGVVASIREHEESLEALSQDLPSIEGSLATLKAEVVRLDALIEGLVEQRDVFAERMERVGEVHRESLGSAKDRRRQALRLLAEAGLAAGLGRLAEAKARAVEQARKRAADKRADEDKQREAMESYDPVAYRRGVGFVVVTVGVVFVGVLGKILAGL